eukprot:gene17874-12813_t
MREVTGYADILISAATTSISTATETMACFVELKLPNELQPAHAQTLPRGQVFAEMMGLQCRPPDLPLPVGVLTDLFSFYVLLMDGPHSQQDGTTSTSTVYISDDDRRLPAATLLSMKKGGSAALAAMIRSRTEGAPAPAAAPPVPTSEPESTSPPRGVSPVARSTSPTPAMRSVSPLQRAPSANTEGPLLISHPKRNFSPTPAARNASPTPSGVRTASPTPAAPALRSASPTPVLRSTAPAAAPRSISPVAALPKTIPFNGANKCHVCEKTVYKMEEIIAVGHVWHDKCFTCGGKTLASTGCGRVLRRDGYVDHDGEPFCQACYSKLYRPKGFNVGVGINTDYGGATAEIVESSSTTTPSPKPAAPAPPAPPAPPAAAAPPAPPTKPAPPVPPAKPVAPPAPAALAAPPAAPAAPPARTISPATSVSNLGGGNKCSICTKTVYKMEEIIALGRIFHDKCFTCGGVHQDGCGKVLKRDGYVDHENEPYCTPCYQRLFGPNTFGYGLSAESTTQPVTGKVAIGTTSKADASGLYKEAGYVGDNDEVDESEW